MASNETIQSLATLLQALRGFNEPRREMEMYAKKSMLQLQNEKELAEFKYNLEKKDFENEYLTDVGAITASLKTEDYKTPEQLQKESKELISTLKGTGLVEKIKEGKFSDISGLDLIRQMPFGGKGESIGKARFNKILEGQQNLISLLGDDIGAAKTASRKKELLGEVGKYKQQINEVLSYKGIGDLDKAGRKQADTLLYALSRYEDALTRGNE